MFSIYNWDAHMLLILPSTQTQDQHFEPICSTNVFSIHSLGDGHKLHMQSRAGAARTHGLLVLVGEVRNCARRTSRIGAATPIDVLEVNTHKSQALRIAFGLKELFQECLSCSLAHCLSRIIVHEASDLDYIILYQYYEGHLTPPKSKTKRLV